MGRGGGADRHPQISGGRCQCSAVGMGQGLDPHPTLRNALSQPSQHREGPQADVRAVSNPSTAFGMRIPPCDLLRHPHLLHLSATSVCSPHPHHPHPPSPSQLPLIPNITGALAKPPSSSQAPVSTFYLLCWPCPQRAASKERHKGRRNFPLGGSSQAGSRDAVPWLVSPTSTLRGSCAP